MMQSPQAIVVFALAMLFCSCSAGPNIRNQQEAEVVRDPIVLLTRPDMEAMRQHRGGSHEVSVSIRMSRGVPVIDAGVNHEAVPLILDTGCQPTLVIDSKAAAWTKVEVLKVARGTLVMEGILGNETASLGRVQRLNLSDWQIEGVPCLIRSHHTSSGASSLLQQIPVNLFGMALPLRACSYLTVDYPRGRAIFGFQKTYIPRSGGRVWNVPLIMRDGTPHVTLSYGGVKWEALVDTGTTAGLTITPQIAKRCGVMSSLTKTDVPVLGVGITNDARGPRVQRVTLPQLQGLGPELRDLTVNVASYSPRIGSRLLSRYRMTLDFQRQCLWLEEQGSHG
jgi:predicted aspartyl protease